MKTKPQTRNETKYQEMLAQQELTRIETRRKRWEAFWKFVHEDLPIGLGAFVACVIVVAIICAIESGFEYIHTTRIEAEQAIDLGKRAYSETTALISEHENHYLELMDMKRWVEMLKTSDSANSVILGELRNRIAKLENPTPAPQNWIPITVTNIPVTQITNWFNWTTNGCATNLSVYCLTNEAPKPVTITNMEWHYYYYDK